MSVSSYLQHFGICNATSLRLQLHTALKIPFCKPSCFYKLSIFGKESEIEIDKLCWLDLARKKVEIAAIVLQHHSVYDRTVNSCSQLFSSLLFSYGTFKPCLKAFLLLCFSHPMSKISIFRFEFALSE